MDTMTGQLRATAEAVRQAEAPEFISGTLTKLRPPLERDLPGLARLMAQQPCGFSWEQEPWTLQRLRKMFEAEKTQGLWTRLQRHYAVTDQSGELIGVLREEMERNAQVNLEFHIESSLPARSEMLQDALQAYLDYRQSWWLTSRIDCHLLGPQAAEKAVLAGLGFELQLSAAEAWMHLGELVSLDVYAWIPQWVRDNRAADGIGE